MNIQDLAPKSVWRNFYALTRVPRPSGHLEKVQEFLLQWASERGIEAYKDGGENIVMKVPATPGMENRPTVVMQAHMDMVPQKTAESTHDFETDPIETHIEGDWLYANGTTLGADDGIGVAIIMAALEDRELQHGPLEALLTSDEETCMYGVNHLASDTLTGKILLNIDDEKMGQFVIGSAGGINVTAWMEYDAEETNLYDSAFKITIKGLRGGHSGLEIGCNRGNANKMMARVLGDLVKYTDASLISWKGGNMRNAIPRECEAVVHVVAGYEFEVYNIAQEYERTFASEFACVEDGIQVVVEEMEAEMEKVPNKVRNDVLNAILACHDGVLRHVPTLPGVVETSSNLAIVDVTPQGAIVQVLARSSNDTYFEYEQTMLERCFLLAGMQVDFGGEYGSWQPKLSSPLVEKMSALYKDMFDETPDVTVVHAGLECSLIGAVYPEMDMVSFGPTLESPHTPNERCLIPTVEKFWQFFRRLLQTL